VLGYKDPKKGKDLYLTIDVRIQKVCDKALEGKTGAAIVMDPDTGQILALSSSPSYDPNVFVRPEESEERTRLLKDSSQRPLFNRAVSGIYPPGSVFKIVVSSAALQLARLNTQTKFNCTGTFVLGRGQFDCWKEGGHGQQNVIEALMNSCNVFFYNAGRGLGVDNIEEFSRMFGFGKKTGIDLPDEAKGMVPGRAWKKAHKKDSWYEGDTVNYSIGQGYLLVTPIQVLEMMSVMANKGSLARPYIVNRVDTDEIGKTELHNIGLSESTIRTVREGLYRVVSSEGGTGKRAKLQGVAMAGKTGTAQNPQGRTHAWFTGFAPFDDAKVCVVVFLEHGGKGGLEPSEIAKEIFEEARRRGYL
jgi:penicillin-binding protein 2